jgi:DNA-binding transcriptional regulator YhcF (GntR family)
MLFKLQFTMVPVLLRHKDLLNALRTLTLNRPTTASQLASEIGTSRQLAYLLLKDLMRTGHVVKRGKTYVKNEEMILNDSIILNLRDVETDRLFKWRIARKLLYWLCTERVSSMAEAARMLNAPYETVKKVKGIFKAAGIVSGNHVKHDYIVAAKHPIDLIPRQEHREVVKHFIDTMETYRPGFQETIVLFGDASWGITTLNLELAVLVHEMLSAGHMWALTEKFVQASENVTGLQGARIDLTIMASSVLAKYKLGLAENFNPTLDEVMNGICVHGRLPDENDLFELMRLNAPPSKEQIESLLKKGYLEPTGDGKFKYTEKAINDLKRKPKSKITEEFLVVKQKRIRLLGVTPPV